MTYTINKGKCNQSNLAMPEGWGSNCIVLSVTQQGSMGIHFVCGKVCQFPLHWVGRVLEQHKLPNSLRPYCV